MIIVPLAKLLMSLVLYIECINQFKFKEQYNVLFFLNTAAAETAIAKAAATTTAAAAAAAAAMYSTPLEIWC